MISFNGTEEDSWFFECDVRKNIVRDQDPAAKTAQTLRVFGAMLAGRYHRETRMSRRYWQWR